MQYPILAGLLVVLLVLYWEHKMGQKKVANVQGNIDRLDREMKHIQNGLRETSDKTDAVSKEFVSLQHGLTSVSNKITGMREQQRQSQPIGCDESQDTHLE
jgi:phage-related tail protein